MPPMVRKPEMRYEWKSPCLWPYFQESFRWGSSLGRWTQVGSSVERLLNFPSCSHCVWAEADSKTPELGAQDAGNSCPLRMTNGFTLSVNKFDGVGGGQGRAPPLWIWRGWQVCGLHKWAPHTQSVSTPEGLKLSQVNVIFFITAIPLTTTGMSGLESAMPKFLVPI